MGRRFGSGFPTMWDGIPPCVTNVGGADDGGRGTNVCICVISCCQDEDFEEARSPPIQWRARKREGAPPSSSNASEPEPNGDGKRELERDPSGEVCHRKEGASED